MNAEKDSKKSKTSPNKRSPVRRNISMKNNLYPLKKKHMIIQATILLGKETFVKRYSAFFLPLFMAAVFTGCSSTGGVPDGALFSDYGAGISARGAVGRLEEAFSGPLFEGDGGKEMRLAVLAPEVQGDIPAYLPVYIQGLLNNNFKRYSAINLIDRQNLDRIISEQDITANRRFSDKDFITIGNLTNAQYFLIGTIQKLPGERYSLQLSITDSATGVRRAGFMKDGTFFQLEGRGTLINEASADLLAQIGVNLTEAGKRALLAGNISAVQAETGLARGITAQAGGADIEALFNFTQSIAFDPSQLEALTRLNTLSSTISGGTISQRILSDFEARDRWIDAFKETARFFNDHPPFEITFDPNLVQEGLPDYNKRTVNLAMNIALDPSEAGFGALNALLEGLEKTGKRKDWGFSGWPLLDINPKTAGTVVFNGKRSFSFKVDVALLNEYNKTLARNSITLNTESIKFSAGDVKVPSPYGAMEVVRFPNIKAEDLTPALTIVIVAVNGIPSQDLNASGYMKIDTGTIFDIVSDGAMLRITVTSITFRANYADFQGLPQPSLETNERDLRRIAQYLNSFRDYSIAVDAHVNPVLGTTREEVEELQPLSYARAIAVVNELVGYGVARSRLSANGMGGTRTVSDPRGIDSWKNRRIEFVLTK